MSADNWTKCPRCKDGDFREDWEVGLSDPEDEENPGWAGGDQPVIAFNYSGECQSCDLSIKLTERWPVPALERAPANAPLTSAAAPCPWSHIPAGWWVQPSPGTPWWEIISTERQGAVQAVGMRSGGNRGIWMRTPDQKVMACPGSARGPMQDALDALPPFEILDDRLEGF